MEEMLRTSASTYQVANVRAAQHWLLWVHMATWIPVFVRQGLSQPNLPFPLRHALCALELWLQMGISCGE